MTTHPSGLSGSVSETLDGTADRLRVAMARLRDRVAADRSGESNPPVNGVTDVPSPPPFEGRGAAHGMLHLVPAVEADPPASSEAHATKNLAAPQGIDATTVQLAQDLLVLAYRSACQSIYVCAAENEQRLREAQDASTRIRATANHAAEAAVRQAEEENVRRLQDVQRRSEALVRVVGAQLRSLGFPEPLDLPMLESLPIAPPLPVAPAQLSASPSLAPPLPVAPAQLPASLPPVAVPTPGPAAPVVDTVLPGIVPRPREAVRREAAPAAAPAAFAPTPPAEFAPAPRQPETVSDGWERPKTVEPRADSVEGAPTRTAEDETAPLGSVELIAGPFGRFSQLAAFTQALNGLPGVLSVATRQFYRGKVHFRLRYDGSVPLGIALAELQAFSPEILAETSNRVEVKVTMEAQADEA